MRRIVSLIGTVASVIAVLLVTGCGRSGAPSTAATSTASARTAAGHTTSSRGSATSTTTATTANTTHAAAPRSRTQPNPGSLPQTPQLPSPHTAVFHAQMRDFWRAVVTGSVAAGMPAFFPEGAYAQVKTLADPRGDWVARLVHGYALDIGAAHRLLGAQPGAAQLLGVRVPMAFAHWVPPGSCYNGVGYWEVPNSRVVYRVGGAERSFGIASLISWRGVWYVVHLGAILRAGDVPAVDDPASGPGVSAPSSTC